MGIIDSSHLRWVNVTSCFRYKFNLALVTNNNLAVFLFYLNKAILKMWLLKKVCNFSLFAFHFLFFAIKFSILIFSHLLLIVSSVTVDVLNITSDFYMFSYIEGFVYHHGSFEWFRIHHRKIIISAGFLSVKSRHEFRKNRKTKGRLRIDQPLFRSGVLFHSIMLKRSSSKELLKVFGGMLNHL